ncbi:MAG: ABC transporter permease [candidate division Zixibacteria bacterium]|nr:ABC transporter permease [candidate division Zixibacteria bacterium]MDH3936227.1 ABC transporter permease [candidate division Zixibacteria bacterium]MDH4032745.1 ABC transporter permease [candidate division Zixibacteria bacterium]
MIPASYTLRNILKYRITSTLTILGIGLVVFVFCASMMLTHGLTETLVSSGTDGNVTVIRQASQTEVQSIIGREQARIVGTFPEIAQDDEGLPIITNEIYVLITLKKLDSGEEGNVVVRGVSDNSMTLRPMITLVEGRMCENEGSEIIVGRSLSERFEQCTIGGRIRFGARDWTVVGIFDAQESGNDSEIWCDVEQAADAFRRPVYSSLTFRIADSLQFEGMKTKIEDDRRLPLEILWEKEYYERQSKTFSTFIGITGNVISVIFSLGAIIGAMITMYAAVANRTKEIGTLRALGFKRMNILLSFLLESLIISLLGGTLGVFGAFFLRFVRVSTTNWDTFSEIAFNFEISNDIVIAAMIFSLAMGIVGGFLPAVRASRMKIVESFRAT